MIKDGSKKPIIAAALFLTFTVCLYAPLSIYVTNRQEFWFNLRTIWYVPTLFFIFSFAFCLLPGLLLKGSLYRLYLGLLFGMACCFYVQGNFLGISAGLMNGNQIDWEAYSGRMLIDLVIWILLLAVCIFVCLRFEKAQKITMYLSLLLFLMQAVSLSVLMGQLLTQKDSVSKNVPVLTMEGMYEAGGTENIIVFILDAYDEQYFDYVRAEEPGIIDELDGFIFYDNYTSVYPTTSYSLTGMMSGKIFKNEMSKQEWVEHSAQDRMYFDELIDNGFDLSFYTPELELIPQRIRNVTTNYAELPMHFYSLRTCFSLIYRLVACQYFPDIVKPYVWMNGTEIQSTGTIDGGYGFYYYENAGFKEGLDQNGLTVKDGAKEYKFIHLSGAHEPFFLDEWGNPADESWDWHPASKGCLRIVNDYIQKLKDAGAYDCSTIIITADHGSARWPGVLSNPIFMIKGKNEHHPLEICSYEAGHQNFAATIADLAGAEDPSQYGLSVLDITEDTKFDRYYYQYVWDGNGARPQSDNGNYFLVEYLTANDTNDTDKFKLTDVEYTPNGESVAHIGNCEGCRESNGVPSDKESWKLLEHRHINGSTLSSIIPR